MFAARAAAAFLHQDPAPPPVPRAPYPEDRDTTRMLELFDAAASRPLTLAELHEAGVGMPGQALYELQLAGFRITRVYGRDEQRGRTLLGYRLAD